jgi:ABC-2 type transport system ATP-binding protein
MIKLTSLTKQYGSLTAVNGINLTVATGEVFGFLGPNGAGKTTTIKMLAGLLQPTGGSAEVCGFDVQREPLRAKAVTGFIPDRPYLYDKLTADEFMGFVARLYDMRDAQGRITDLLGLFGLTDWSNELVENFSHGMKQRLVMASSLLHEPKVLVVDEPMVGLDPLAIIMVKNLFKRLASQGVTIFMSTHTLKVAEDICDRIGVIVRGRLIASGTAADLRREANVSSADLEQVFLNLTGN